MFSSFQYQRESRDHNQPDIQPDHHTHLDVHIDDRKVPVSSNISFLSYPKVLDFHCLLRLNSFGKTVVGKLVKIGGDLLSSNGDIIIRRSVHWCDCYTWLKCY